jgi:hypothetical protein
MEPAMKSVLLALLLLPAAVLPDDAEIIKAQKPSYPLTTCVISGEELGSGGMKAVDVVRDGHLVSLCCKMCTKELDKDPAAAIRKIEAAVVAAQSVSYPLDACVVGGDKLDDKAVSVVVGTKLVKLCCNDCKKSLLAEPSKYVARVDQAWIVAQSANYPLDICPISEHALGDKPVKYLHGVTLVQLCCEDCVPAFEKDPKPVLAKLAAARAKAPAGEQRPVTAPPAGEHGAH